MSIASIPARLRAEARSTTSLEEDESPLSRVITNELLDIKSPRLWRGAAAEFLGTALLSIFTIGLGLKKDGQEGPSLLQGALGTGFFLAGLISAFSNVSGAHVNPAISIGFLVTRQITFVRCLAYSIFQTTGAVAGTAFLKVVIPSDLIGNLGLINPGSGITPYEALGVEILITFFLMFVVLSLIDPGRDDLAGSVPLMVGLTVTVNILFAGQLSGACMNPARNFGSALMMGDFENHWLYWAGPTAGAILGALSYDWFFSTSPFEINALKKLTGKDDEKENKNGMYGINGNEKDLNLQIDDENEDDEEEASKIMLKEKLRAEYTNGLPRDVDKREFNEFRRTSLKDKLQSGSLGKISIKEEESNENLSLGNLAAAPESKI